MCHRDQFQLAVEHAKHVVALEVYAFHVTAHLLVAGGMAEAQVTVAYVESEQVSDDVLAVARANFADLHHRGRPARRLLRRSNRRAVKERFVALFHGAKYKGLP